MSCTCPNITAPTLSVTVGPVPPVSAQTLGLAIGLGAGIPVCLIVALVIVSVKCAKKRIKMRRKASLPRCECCCGMISEPKCCFPDCKLDLNIDMSIDLKARRIECKEKQLTAWKKLLEFQKKDFELNGDIKVKGDDFVKAAMKLLKKFPNRRGIKKLVKLSVEGNEPAMEALAGFFKPFFTRKFILKDLGLKPVATHFSNLGLKAGGFIPSLPKKEITIGDIDAATFPYISGEIHGKPGLFYPYPEADFEGGLIPLHMQVAISMASDFTLPVLGFVEKDGLHIGCKAPKFGILRDCFFDTDLATYLSISKKLNMAISCAGALRCFHASGMIHGNINCHGVFMDEAGLNFGEDFDVPDVDLFEEAPVVFFLTNFTIAGMKEIDYDKAVKLGISPYLAPELYAKVKKGNLTPEDWHKSADIYMFGYLLWEAYHEEVAYRRDVAEDEDPEEKKTKETFDEEAIAKICENADEHKKKDVKDEDDESTPLHISQNCPWRDIITSCWSKDPEDRPTIDELISDLESLNQSLRRIVKCCW